MHSHLSPELAASWTDHVDGIHSLGEAIRASGWMPTAILGIARGGLIPAAMLAYILDVRRLQSVRVQHYDCIKMRLESGPQFVDAHEPFSAFSVYTERLLIVDDIVDTGGTLNLVLDAARDHADEVKVATLYVRSNQIDAADWHWRVEDEWVAFPWAPDD